MKPRDLLFSAACLSIAFHARSAPGQQESTTVGFITNAPQTWKQYIGNVMSQGLACDVSVERRVLGERRPSEKWEIDLLVDDPNYAYRVKAFDASGKLTARTHQIANKRYSFSVAGVQDWNLEKITLQPHSVGVAENELGDRFERGRTLHYACKGLIVKETWLPPVVESTTFRVLQESVVMDSEGKELVQVDYEYVGARGKNVLGSGRLVVDPSLSWMIVQAMVGLSFPDGNATLDITNEYDDTSASIPMISRRVETQHLGTFSKRGKEVMATEYRYSWRNAEEADYSPADFTLTSYGFEEPDRGVDTSALYFAGAAVVCGALAIAARRWFVKQ